MTIQLNGKTPTKIVRWHNGAEQAVKKIVIFPDGVTEKQIRPVIPPYLCFTAETAGSTITLNKYQITTAVNLETSTDGNTWSDYSFGTTITLSNVGDKLYWRNKSETVTGFSTSTSRYYYFVTSGSLAVSGDCNYLLCKNSTDTLSNYCFYLLFNGTSITTPPKLPATTLGQYCYYNMFLNCTNLIGIPNLPSLDAPISCYRQMFRGCSSIKLSSSQTGNYTKAYRIPTTGTMNTTGSYWNYRMFLGTGGTFVGDPVANKTYYTSNQVI